MGNKSRCKQDISNRIVDAMKEKGWSQRQFYDAVTRQLYSDYPDTDIEWSFDAFKKQIYGENSPSRPEQYIAFANALNVSLDYLFTGKDDYVVKDSFQLEPDAKSVYRAVAHIYRALSKDAMYCKYSFQEELTPVPLVYRYISLEFYDYNLRKLLAALFNIDIDSVKLGEYDLGNVYDATAILLAENKRLVKGRIVDELNVNQYGNYIDLFGDYRDVQLMDSHGVWDPYEA